MVAHVDEDVKNSSHLNKKEQGFMDYFSQNTQGNFQIIHADLQQSMNEIIFLKN